MRPVEGPEQLRLYLSLKLHLSPLLLRLRLHLRWNLPLGLKLLRKPPRLKLRRLKLPRLKLRRLKLRRLNLQSPKLLRLKLLPRPRHIP
jgi:hypothetical protein